MFSKNKIDVLYIHPSRNESDYSIPMGVIGLMNSIDCIKIGKMYFEVTEDIISNSKIIAMDCHWYFSLSEIGRMAKEFKKINPSIVIIIGGHTATVFAEMIVDRFKIDYVIKGDAEIPFPLLIKELLEGRDGRHVPNIVNKRFTTPQSYHLTREDYSKYDYITIDWFPIFKERMIKIHKVLPFGCNGSLGLYPFIPVYKGCKYNCNFCYARKQLQKKLYRRALVSRTPESIIKDLQICSKHKEIKQVHMIADFVNILDEEYTNKIFSQKYDINLYYEFEHFNSPPIDILGKMMDCFNKCYFTFIFSEPFNKHPEARFIYLREVLNYFKNSAREVKVNIYRGHSKKIMKYSNELKRNYEGLIFGSCKQWFRPMPLIYKNNNDSENERYFNFWKKKADKITSKHFVAKSHKDDNSRFHALLGDALMDAKEYNKAIHNYNAALNLDSNNITIHLSLASAYFNLKRYEEAIKEANKAIELDCKEGKAYLILSFCYEKIKQYKKAINELKKAEKMIPGDPGINFSLFNWHRKIAQIEHSNKELDKAILKLRPLKK
ncbi:MAG: tetratricopeptide repeat protein [Candidatus Omnitrophota bacterium]